MNREQTFEYTRRKFQRINFDDRNVQEFILTTIQIKANVYKAYLLEALADTKESKDIGSWRNSMHSLANLFDAMIKRGQIEYIGAGPLKIGERPKNFTTYHYIYWQHEQEVASKKFAIYIENHEPQGLTDRPSMDAIAKNMTQTINDGTKVFDNMAKDMKPKSICPDCLGEGKIECPISDKLQCDVFPCYGYDNNCHKKCLACDGTGTIKDKIITKRRRHIEIMIKQEIVPKIDIHDSLYRKKRIMKRIKTNL